MERSETTSPARREYRRPAAPEVVATVPEAAAAYAYYGGQDLGFYSSVPVPS